LYAYIKTDGLTSLFHLEQDWLEETEASFLQPLFRKRVVQEIPQAFLWLLSTVK
jgi:hypothetical protein